MNNAVEWTRRLIQCPSITPHDAGAIDILINILTPLGFQCFKLVFEEKGTPPVTNLYARWGTGSPHLCFAGHTDVVPPGDLAAWKTGPFQGSIKNDRVYGRGAADMKGAIACFISALVPCLSTYKGSLSLLITGDEEGPGINGTSKLLQWLHARHEIPDFCLVGEPTSEKYVGDTIKIGRRGSLNFQCMTYGTQGHTAYGHLADNPLPRLINFLKALEEAPLDAGTPDFPPSSLQITTIDVGNMATNVIPGQGKAAFNIRYNPLHTPASLTHWITTLADLYGIEVILKTQNQAFLCPPHPFHDGIKAAVQQVTGAVPISSTTGGTSDARFIQAYCPVLELGLLNATIHQANEHVALEDLASLTKIYGQIINTLL